MKVTKEINEKGLTEIHSIMTVEEAELTQAAILQFAEKTANKKAHQVKMRRLAILIDKKL